MIAAGVIASAPVVDVLARDADGPEFGKASPLGLLIVLVLLVATVFLIRSMSRHLKKLPADFDRDDPVADQAADEGTDAPGVPDVGPGDGSDSTTGRRPHTE
ncbi:hypothetical protein LX12_001632 [Williamsia serinedens]|uniref:Secreted protein n=1 Tax=Williamsia serinedens TaxID=391736 RepID=A0ABT1GZL7_9NOCA|nr:hypothetical protein [Williamsia serinedens]